MKERIATSARSPNKTPVTLDVEVFIDWMDNSRVHNEARPTVSGLICIVLSCGEEAYMMSLGYNNESDSARIHGTQRLQYIYRMLIGQSALS